uniref:hypothetical protein n=1 Tax=Clostridium sp. NkU-1 TaxID=1095009 RepID=UPI00326050E5
MVALMSVGLVPLIIVSILYQNILNNRIVEDTKAASIEKLKYLSMNIERQMEAAEQLLGWITYNQRLERILTNLMIRFMKNSWILLNSVLLPWSIPSMQT